jgi:hypothetical protein
VGEQTTSNQLVVLMVPTTQPEPIEAYSMRVAEKWKIGRKGQDNGALFLIAKNDRKMRIEVGYGSRACCPTSRRAASSREDVAPAVPRGQVRRGHQRRRRQDHRSGRRRDSGTARRAQQQRSRAAVQTSKRGSSCCSSSCRSWRYSPRIFGRARGDDRLGIVRCHRVDRRGSIVIGVIAGIVAFIVMIFSGIGGGFARARRRIDPAVAGWRRRRRLRRAAGSRVAAAASAAAARRATGEREIDAMTVTSSSPLLPPSRDRSRQRPARVSTVGVRADRSADRRRRKTHRGQVRFAVEAGAAAARVLAGVTPRERALDVFGCCGSGTPKRTAASSSTCCSPTATSRSSPIAAFTRASERKRGSGCAERWKRNSARPLRRGRRDGARDESTLLAEHYPRDGAARRTSFRIVPSCCNRGQRRLPRRCEARS